MSTTLPSGPFSHPALFYRGQDAYLAGTVPFVDKGLASGEPVAVAVPEPQLTLLRDALGARAADVKLIDMRQAGRNPGRIIPRVLRAFADAHPGRRVRIIGEPVWPGRSQAEYPACAQHEALINHAFAGREATILCPYDIAGLDRRALRDARATHPVVVDDAAELPSADYEPDRIVADYNQPMDHPVGAPAFPFDADLLPDARHFARRRAHVLGLPAEREDDLALAVAELTTNSIVHGGGRGTLRVWSEDGHLVGEVRDRGHLTDPLAGRCPPPPAQPGGRGLLLVNTVTDLVRVHTHPRGTAIRFYLTLPAPPHGR